MNKAATNKEVRINNQKRIVNTLFHYGPMTKQELAGRLGLSLPTISVINKNLSAKGLVMQGEKLESTGGRPPSYIRLVFDARHSIGIDISSRHVRIVQVNLGPEVIHSAKHRLDYTGDLNYWEKVQTLLSDFIAENKIDDNILLGVGFSIQAPIEFGKAVVASNQAASIADTALDHVQRLFGEDIEIHNDAKMASLAQVWGVGEEDDVIYLMLSGGVGGAIITNHQILRGNSKNAEFGHMVVQDKGRPCTCGQYGCLGAYCSSRALIERSGVSLDEFFVQLREGHQAFQQIWDEYMYCLALAVSNLHVIFDTDVIIGGEMSPYINQFLPDLCQQAARRNPFGKNGDYIRIGSYGEYDSAIGAALIYNDKFLS